MTGIRLDPRTTPTARGPRASGERILALDVIRGVALCGIVFVNIAPLTRFGTAAGFYETPALDTVSGWLQLVVQQRFFPVFALLFGIGFSILLASATRTAARPRLVLLRRLLLLLAIGIPFQFLQPGSALLPFAVVGLVILLPSTWLPRPVVAVAAVVVTVAGVVGAGGGLALIPGVFLLGSALTRYGAVERIGRARRGSLVVMAVATASAVPLVLWQATAVEQSGFSVESAAAGLAMAAAWAALVSYLMTTWAARPLRAAFAPLGRMALTNYVAAAPLMLAAGGLLDLPHATSWAPVLGTAVAVLVGQGIVSALWLRVFTQGPLEWLWRWGTWGRRAPLRRVSPTAGRAGA
ncbi:MULTISPECIES: DUF418 domain-containing protein [Clavibacter]|uniref:DUF418 domain-containing protein n=2 Tax=Clavibacter TaxID=1573 RepID=A0A399NVG8_9MICO|nr:MULTISPECIES: DUF418 domain-containing protein [Clavibacter]KDP89877.1 hypothetical protein W824_10145 [Clavibacter cf. michiganensis LMG 26808]RII97309.1 DUF418 domain-containing protein [Clavibacter michiganensis]UKF24077.1 DUF418 domain-containing protein [Clavibacter sp. A6099]